MKKMMSTVLMFAALVSFNSAAFASGILQKNSKCYKALNPNKITIRNLETNKIETAKSANVVLNDFKSTVDGFETSPLIEVNVRSKSFKFSTVAAQYSPDVNTYSVDCDGGNVTVQMVGGILVLNSEYLAGDITYSEGCGTGTITFKDLALEQVSCQKP